MSKNECLALDWRTIGYEDGVAGYAGDHISTHRRACGKYGVRADLAQYQMGREQGLREYCQPSNGYRVGERGGSYGGICPAGMEREFLSAYDAGHHLYVLRARVSDTESQLYEKRRQLDHAQHGVVANTAAVVSENSTPVDRVDAVVDTAKLAERAGRLKEEIRQLEQDRERYQRDLDEYLASHPE